MTKELQRFFGDESGPELVEWAVVTIILLLATIPVLISISNELKRIFEGILTQLERIP